MGKSNKLFQAVVSGVKAFKSPSKDKAEKERSSSKHDKDQRKGGKEKCLWSLGKSYSRSHDRSVAAFLDVPEVKSVQVEELGVSHGLFSAGSHASAYIDASKSLNNIHDQSVAGCGTLHCTESFVQEDLAAVRIQAAIRRYLTTKRRIRVLRAVVRLQALWRGQRVRKQAVAALRVMQALIKVQALARGHRIRSSELGQLIQKHIQQTRQQKRRSTEGWVSSTATLEQLQAKAQSKQDAVMKRQRALVYAFSEQLNKCSSKQISSSSVDYQPDKSHGGWARLEQWTAVQQAGISRNAAKGQCRKCEIVKNKSNADLQAEERKIDVVPSKEIGGNDHFTVTVGDNDVVLDDTGSGSPALEENKTVNHGSERGKDQVKRGQENFPLDMPKVDLVERFLPPPSSSSSSPLLSLSLPPPPPPPPPPPRVSAKLVTRSSPSNSFQSPSLHAASSSSQVCTKAVQRPVSSVPPPPPPPPPHMKRVKPLFVHERSSSECQQVVSLPSTLSQSTKSSLSILAPRANQLSGGGNTPNDAMRPFTTAVLPVHDAPSSVTTMSKLSSSVPNEPLPVPNAPSTCGDPLLEASSPTPAAASNAPRMNGIMQDPCDGATFSTATISPLPKSMSSVHSSVPLSRELPTSSPDQRANSPAPFIIPNVTDEGTLDLAEKSTLGQFKDDCRETGVINVDAVKNAEDGICMNSNTDIGDQGEIDMDVDEPDEVDALQLDVANQSDTLTERNGLDHSKDAVITKRPIEVSTDKHVTSSRQGQFKEETSPRLPNYMTATKSAKAKIRSPSPKGDSPTQPKFDVSKAKFESPKQKQDLTKQKAESPSQKAEVGVNNRHVMSTSESKVSAGANKLPTGGVWAKSKGPPVSTKGSKSSEEYLRINGQ